MKTIMMERFFFTRTCRWFAVLLVAAAVLCLVGALDAATEPQEPDAGLAKPRPGQLPGSQHL